MNELFLMAGCMAHEREGYISTSGLTKNIPSGQVRAIRSLVCTCNPV